MNIRRFQKEAEDLTAFSPEADPAVWKKNIHYHQIQEYRYFHIIRLLQELTPPEDSVFLDIGCYPGDIGVLLKHFFPKTTVYGSGLCIDEIFQKRMKDIYRKLFYVEFDPINPLSNKTTANTIELPSHSVDFIIAGEIFEHFYSPLHFLQECHRLLKTGGILLLTTPNLSYIGNVFRLLNSKSIYPDLHESHIFQTTEWRPHERIYTHEEICELMKLSRFSCYRHIYIDNHYEQYQKKSLKTKLRFCLIKSFYAIPRFRPQYIGLFRAF